jgi:hypothetical protein
MEDRDRLAHLPRRRPPCLRVSPATPCARDTDRERVVISLQGTGQACATGTSAPGRCYWPFQARKRRDGCISANRTLTASASGTSCRMPSSARYSMPNSPGGGAGSSPCAADSVLLITEMMNEQRYLSGSSHTTCGGGQRHASRYDHLHIDTSARKRQSLTPIHLRRPASRHVVLCHSDLRHWQALAWGASDVNGSRKLTSWRSHAPPGSSRRVAGPSCTCDGAASTASHRPPRWPWRRARPGCHWLGQLLAAS